MIPPDTQPLSARWLTRGGEGLLISLATLSAWPFAGVLPFAEYLLTAGVGLLVLVWAVHAVVTRASGFRLDLVSGALAGLILFTACQLVPLPLGVVKVLSPARANWHETLLPEQLEQLPGEAASPRSDFVPLSVCPNDTRTLAARMIAVLAVYAAARNWLAGRESRGRFAWAVTINGVLLAVVGLGQFFSSRPGVVFWSVETDGAVFGPFVCRNHYPDYLAFGIGGAMYLLHQKKNGGRTVSGWRGRLLVVLEVFERPGSLFAAVALGLMLASVPFTQSRGGVAAVAVAGIGVAVLAGWGRKRAANVAVGVALAVGVGLVLWLGLGPITDRFRDDGHTLVDRLPLWESAGKQLPGLWATGGGGGTFRWVEPLGRTTQPANVLDPHAHNEYLEAAVEGGVVRFTLTLLLAVGVPVVMARTFLRLRGRSAGAFALGVWFAVVVLAVHAAVDFAVHLPAVALMAAAAVGMVGQFRVPSSEFRVEQDTTADAQPTKRGVFLLPSLLTFAMIAVALDARGRWRADDLRLAAEATDDTATRVEWQSLRTRVAPSDPSAWFDLAQAQLRSDPHSANAFADLRTARGLCPLHPDVHLHLGLKAKRFERAEPGVVHLKRATTVLPTDADVWFVRGMTEREAGEKPEASWRQSLTFSPKRLTPILKESSGLSATELRERVLPDDPAVLMATAELRPTGERRGFVDAAAGAVDRDGLNVSQLKAVASACDESDRIDDAVRMWHRATAANPTSRELRDTAARWFEQQERYGDAVPHLDWLANRSRNDVGLRDRLAAARHGAELKRVIGK